MNIYIFFSMKYCEFWKKLMAFDSLAHIFIIANVRKKNMKQISSEWKIKQKSSWIQQPVCVRQIKYSSCVRDQPCEPRSRCNFCALESLESKRRSKIERERERGGRTEGVQGQRGRLFLSAKGHGAPENITSLLTTESVVLTPSGPPHIDCPRCPCFVSYYWPFKWPMLLLSMFYSITWASQKERQK